MATNKANTEKVVSTQPLHIRCRPQTLDEVVGQDEVTAALQRLLDDKATRFPHAFLFFGPSGTGKTTLARILARELGCKQGLIEIDAASHSGIDDMRVVMDNVRYQAFGDSPIKVVIVDEAQGLSKNAWNSLLLSIEDPPKHVYWCLCTTEVNKVPETIRTRCHTYTLRAVPQGVLSDYLAIVAEDYKVDVQEEILQVCAREAFGSVRQALVNLSTVAGCEDRKEAYRLLASVLEGGEAVELAKMLVAGGCKWDKLRELLYRLRDENPESIRMVVVSYVQRVLLDAKDERRVAPLLNILGAFSEPFNSSEKMAPVLLAVGGLLYEKA